MVLGRPPLPDRDLGGAVLLGGADGVRHRRGRRSEVALVATAIGIGIGIVLNRQGRATGPPGTAASEARVDRSAVARVFAVVVAAEEHWCSSHTGTTTAPRC